MRLALLAGEAHHGLVTQWLLEEPHRALRAARLSVLAKSRIVGPASAIGVCYEQRGRRLFQEERDRCRWMEAPVALWKALTDHVVPPQTQRARTSARPRRVDCRT